MTKTPIVSLGCSAKVCVGIHTLKSGYLVMKKEDALAALSALGHPRRLDAFRLLVAAAPDGLLAGDIAERLGSKQNTMSTNLAVLLRAKLVRARREGRGVRYTADTETFGTLLRYLAKDCSGNAPGECADGAAAVETVAPASLGATKLA